MHSRLPAPGWWMQGNRPPGGCWPREARAWDLQQGSNQECPEGWRTSLATSSGVGRHLSVGALLEQVDAVKIPLVCAIGVHRNAQGVTWH